MSIHILEPADYRTRFWRSSPPLLFRSGTLALVVAGYLTWRLNWMDWHAWAGDALSRTISSHMPSDGIGTRHRR
jgi:hypothetical protein